MQPPAMTPTVRSILLTDMNLSTDEIMRRAKNRGVKASDKSLRETIYNVKSELRRKPALAGASNAPAKVAPAAARETKAPEITPDVSAPSSSTPDLATTLANVSLVNTVMGVCGGADQARQVAEAVRSCGSVDAFLQHLELVAQVRGGESL